MFLLVQVPFFSVFFLRRGFVPGPAGVFQGGAQVETGDPGGGGPYGLFGPVPGLLGLLASPTLRPS